MPENELPVSAAERMDYKSKELAKRLFNRRKALLTAMGDRPYGATPASPQKIRQRLAEMRNDPAAWAEVLAKVGKPKEDGRFLLPKKLIEEVKKYEGELREGFMV